MKLKAGLPYGGYQGPIPAGYAGGPQMPMMGGGFGFGDPSMTMFSATPYRSAPNPFEVGQGGQQMSGLERAAIIAQILGTVGGLGLETYGAYRQGKQEDREREQRERDRAERARGIAPVLREYLGT